MLAAGLLLFALGVPGDHGCGGTAPAQVTGQVGKATSQLTADDDGDSAVGPWTAGNRGVASRKNPMNACRAAHGTCVGAEAGACARGTIGDATRYSCNDTTLRCCLP